MVIDSGHSEGNISVAQRQTSCYVSSGKSGAPTGGSDFVPLDTFWFIVRSASSPGQICFIIAEPVRHWMKFQKLAADWRVQRGATSSITDAAMCQAYQQVIAMGQAAVPLIMRQLRAEGDQPDQWFWALTAITGANPVPDEDRGNFRRMAAAWLNWDEQSRWQH